MQGVIIFAIFYVFIITLQIKSGKGFGMAIDNSSFWQLLVIFGGIATFLINAIWYMQTGKEFWICAAHILSLENRPANDSKIVIEKLEN